MNPRIAESCARLLLFLTLAFCLSGVASAQGHNPAQPPPVKSPLRNSQAPGTKALVTSATPSWPPADVDQSVPPVAPHPACSLPQVLSRAGRRAENIVRDLDRFPATEPGRYQNVNHEVRLNSHSTTQPC